ncbi:hypothetical protein EV644_12122 [Kribbella orskensis]|uniref:WbqC-like protein n=1 Tax=Kribbella orskensis TaxID=2512216 RepID=A0ABY2BCP9_9ACTN|nr:MULTISPECIES: hypothetical protein [Kribbella]TCN33651.1 hypothetical protein EV642_123110 [Kribbella sp. VKM Ac-2500]TCO13942.1 hypothetical protein EV644_12122 [Kribbella orskensis]
MIAPRLGLLDDLPVILWPADARGNPSRRSWKTPHVAEWVGARPIVWIDDEVNRYDRFYLDAVERLGPYLLHRVEANRGLVPADFDVIQAWAQDAFEPRSIRLTDHQIYQSGVAVLTYHKGLKTLCAPGDPPASLRQ